MKNYNPVGWFEIPTEDLERATTFYEKLLDITLDQQDMGELKMAWFPMHEDAIGSAGTLVHSPHYTPSDKGVLIYFTAPDLDGTVAKVEELGGEVVIARKDIGEHGVIAVIKDTEGNQIALHSREK